MRVHAIIDVDVNDIVAARYPMLPVFLSSVIFEERPPPVWPTGQNEQATNAEMNRTLDVGGLAVAKQENGSGGRQRYLPSGRAETANKSIDDR